MNDPARAANARAPWHLWLVGILSLVWNGAGAADYLLTVSQNVAYLAMFTAEQLEYFATFPAWAIAAWAIAVWSDVLGSVLLLLRRRYATVLFEIGLAGLIVTTFHTVLTNGFEIMGGAAAVAFTTAIFLTTVGLIVYSLLMARRGVLR
jgi:hypothetical protein